LKNKIERQNFLVKNIEKNFATLFIGMTLFFNSPLQFKTENT